MERVAVNGIELEAEALGSGEPVLLIHGGFTNAWGPLLRQPVLAERCRLINYNRRNFAGSTHATNTPNDHLADALALLQHYGASRAHIVGHGGSGVMALRMAIDAPDVVHSLVLLEAALPQEDEGSDPGRVAARPALERGDIPTFVRTSLEGAMGEGYEDWDRGLPPGWFEQAVADQVWIRQQGPVVPPLTSWTPEVAQRVTQPALVVVGEKSYSAWYRRHEQLLHSLPQAEPFVLPGATHAMQVMNPGALAGAMSSFFARHPIDAQ